MAKTLVGHSMASASSAIEVPVFIDTNLGTHIALSVCPDITVAEFKRKFKTMHSDCYPEIGNISIDGLMVKMKSFFYHLPESMPIKHAFQGSKGSSFLYTEAYPLNKDISSWHTTEVVRGGLSDHHRKKDCTKRKRKKTMRKGFQCSIPDTKSVYRDIDLSKTMATNKHKQGSNACSYVEPTSERASGSVSVSGIIKKYFSLDDEVTSTHPKAQVPKYAPNTPPAMMNVRSSRDEKKSRGVGKRLIVAANNLGISTSNRKPVISLCKYKLDKLSVLKSSSPTRNLVFELGEE